MLFRLTNLELTSPGRQDTRETLREIVRGLVRFSARWIAERPDSQKAEKQRENMSRRVQLYARLQRKGGANEPTNLCVVSIIVDVGDLYDPNFVPVDIRRRNSQKAGN